MAKEIRMSFKNCRNITAIEGGYLPLVPNKVNILFGRNGTGKTTIARVLKYWNDPSNEKLEELNSFTYLQQPNEQGKPVIEVPAKTKKPTFVFDTEWVENHCFREGGNLHEDAYELYVSSPRLKQLQEHRKQVTTELDDALHSKKTEAIRSLAADAAKSIGVTAAGQASKTFKENGPLEGLPSFMKPVVDGLVLRDRAQWVSWHVNGAPFAQRLNGACPYCAATTSDMSLVVGYDNMHAVSQGVSWEKAVSVFARAELFRYTVNRRALNIMGGREQPTAEELQWIKEQAKRARRLADCIDNAREDIRLFGGGVIDTLIAQLRQHLQVLEDKAGFSDQVRAVMKTLASTIRTLINNENKIRTVANKIEEQASANALKYKKDIDSMLSCCGYPYTVEIRSDLALRTSKVLLVPKTTGSALETDTRRTLSYGEQNTLALIFFMFEAIAEPFSHIIVLDDPISSFDGDKRFALLYRMFHAFDPDAKASEKRQSLSGRTVVMLTHDYLVVSDVLTILKGRGKIGKTHALYLSCSQEGVLSHTSIETEDVRPYVQMIARRVERSAQRDTFFQLVYLRCYCEMTRRGNKDGRTGMGCAFKLISSIVDGDSWDMALGALKWDGKSEQPYMLRVGTNFIRKYIPDFDFASMFSKIRKSDEINRLYNMPGITPYEKLQVLRLLIRQNKIPNQNPVFTRYANEVYHLAGDYLLQLDPVDFNPVPPTIEAWCDGEYQKFYQCLRVESEG